ncbi:carbohydrate-binding module family 14 protein [Nocardia sp. NPDC049149]|uniref:carbohydrate-binding module family 14 protein n=1 Tax=Nocardia sp. NPDC049149 TaxID=3364315 RepID=UPI0037136D2E
MTVPADFCTGKADGDYPYPNDRTKFVTCSNGMTQTQDCPPGLVFDPKSGTCLNP